MGIETTYTVAEPIETEADKKRRAKRTPKSYFSNAAYSTTSVRGSRQKLGCSRFLATCTITRSKCF